MSSELNRNFDATPIVSSPVVAFPSPFARDVMRGLTASPKSLPSMYLYDDVGSMLFEAICHLDVYHCARAEKRILLRCADQLMALLPPQTTIAELGGGSGEKAAMILSRFQRPVEFHNIDISSKALDLAQHSLSELPNVRYHGWCSDILHGLHDVSASRTTDAPLLVLFLGSSIGNYDRTGASRLFTQLHSSMRKGDYLLLGTDLVKPVPQLLAAYDDPALVTAAFNKNILVRINRELGADFVPAWFRHESRWNAEHERVEMHLVSTRSHSVTLPAVNTRLVFRAGETIHTENSHKYRADQIGPWTADHGFELVAQWVDTEGMFATNLLRSVAIN